MPAKVELTKRVTEALITRGRTIWKGAELWFPCFANEDRELVGPLESRYRPVEVLFVWRTWRG